MTLLSEYIKFGENEQKNPTMGIHFIKENVFIAGKYVTDYI